MRKPVSLIPLLLVSLLPAAPATAWAADDRERLARAQPAERREFVPGEVLVRVKATSRDMRASADRAAASVGGRIAQRLDAAVPGLQRVTLDRGVSVQKAVAELEARDDVVYAEPNYIVRSAAVPTDSRFRELWGLHNTGQTVRGVAGAPDADIDAPEAWNVTTGSASVTVAVLDSGVAYDHPDLAPNMWVNSDEIAGNGVDDDRNGFVDDRRGWDFVAGDADPTDEEGHGTHVAGTIGARANNDAAGAGTTDVAGVAWTVRLMPVRVLDNNGEGSYADLIDGINYARQNGAQIGNLSIGATWYSDALRDALGAASGVLWVAAAGNDWVDLDLFTQYPCEFEVANIVCVAATDSRDRVASFSNYGSTTVDVAAPGESILSASPYSRRFVDDFETSIAGRWVTGGTPNTWALTTDIPAAGATGTWLTDSPTGFYPNSSDNWARTPALSFRGTRDCRVQFKAVYDIESYFDFLRVEAATSTAGPWTEIGTLTGYWPAPDETLEAPLPEGFDGVGTAYLRFRLNPDEQYNGDGAYIDTFAVDCVGRFASDSFQYLSGTSMATPHVSGVAALAKARFPSLTTAQLRAKLLASVDKKTSLTGKVVTGGRINANKAVR